MQISKEDINVESVVKTLQLVDEDNTFGLSSFEKKAKMAIYEIRKWKCR